MKNKLSISVYLLAVEYLEFVVDAQIRTPANERTPFAFANRVSANPRGFSVKKAPEIIARFWPGVSAYHFMWYLRISCVRPFADLLRFHREFGETDSSVDAPVLFKSELRQDALFFALELNRTQIRETEQKINLIDPRFLDGFRSFLYALHSGELTLSSLGETMESR